MRRRESLEETGTFELALDERARPAKVGHGQNPYDTVPSVREPGSMSRHKDLRRLSEWIRTKKHVDDLKKSNQDPPETSIDARLAHSLPPIRKKS